MQGKEEVRIENIKEKGHQQMPNPQLSYEQPRQTESTMGTQATIARSSKETEEDQSSDLPEKKFSFKSGINGVHASMNVPAGPSESTPGFKHMYNL